MRSVKCGVWSAKCEVWSVECEECSVKGEVCSVEHEVSLGVASKRGRAQVLFFDNDNATGSHKARTHGPGWRTVHASSKDEKGLLVQHT